MSTSRCPKCSRCPSGEGKGEMEGQEGKGNEWGGEEEAGGRGKNRT